MLNKEIWKFCCSKKNYEKLRSNPIFMTLIRLARVINALSFCDQAGLIPLESDVPAYNRQLINSYIYKCGVLYEGLNVVRTLGKYLSEYETYKCGLAVLLKDTKVKRIENALNCIRNKIAFHFDDDIFSDVLSKSDPGEYVFIKGYGFRNGDLYYYMADIIAINYIIGESDLKKQEEVLKEVLVGTNDVASSLIESAEKLFCKILPQLGFYVVIAKQHPTKCFRKGMRGKGLRRSRHIPRPKTARKRLARA